MTLPVDPSTIDLSPQASCRRARLIVASNRLPVSVQLDGNGVRANPSAGGLQSALVGLQHSEPFTWVGWPGAVIPPAAQDQVRALLAAQRWAPVFLSEAEERHYYHGLCNGAIWPLFHYCTDRVEFVDRDWEHYVAVNEAFARTILEIAEPGDRVWVHDFHLMLLPRLLRERQPELEIGFFQHIPFPSSEIYRLFPRREELLRGMLGADYIGFHTHDYARHFRSACLRILGIESSPECIETDHRRIGVGAHPIGIEVDHFRALMRSPETHRHLEDLRRHYGRRKLVLGIERLDYSKGVPQKLQAFERYLRQDPGRAGDVTMMQVLVPSRLQNPEYQRLKREIEEQIGRINGEFGRPGLTPVEYMHRNLAPEQLVALYMFADVGFVNPLRDGMNLVAQEYVLCQEQAKGVLLLSEFAGAAHVLGGALLANPWNIERTADTLAQALAMPDEEKRARMLPMIERVVAMDSQRWAMKFLAKQREAAAANRATTHQTLLCAKGQQAIVDRFLAADRRVLFLDYDGTLREICKTPAEAKPTPEIVELLRALAAMPDTHLHLVSGRRRETLQEWFGDLPIALAAEHGYWIREQGRPWTPIRRVDLEWMPRVRTLLEEVASEVPGSFVEQKHIALGWHYRLADPDYGSWRAKELVSLLQEGLGTQQVQVIHGHKLVEVRAFGVHKGAYVQRVLGDTPERAFVLCIGDDRTDHDMYEALPQDAVSIHVGAGGEGVTHALENPAAVRALLRRSLVV